jgi:hypothetical protein
MCQVSRVEMRNTTVSRLELCDNSVFSWGDGRSHGAVCVLHLTNLNLPREGEGEENEQSFADSRRVQLYYTLFDH